MTTFSDISCYINSEMEKRSDALVFQTTFADWVSMISSNSQKYIFVKDAFSRFQFANDNFLHLFGLKRVSQIIGLSDLCLCRDKMQAQKYVQLDQQVIRSNQKLPVMERILPKTDKAVIETMEGTLYPLYNADLKSTYIFGVVSPHAKLIVANLETIFKLKTTDLDKLLVKKSYFIETRGRKFTLSRREIQCVISLFKGKHAGEVADDLGLQQVTIEFYINNLKNKLGANSKSDLLNKIISWDVLQQVFRSCI